MTWKGRLDTNLGPALYSRSSTSQSVCLHLKMNKEMNIPQIEAIKHVKNLENGKITEPTHFWPFDSKRKGTLLASKPSTPCWWGQGYWQGKGVTKLSTAIMYPWCTWFDQTRSTAFSKRLLRAATRKGSPCHRNLPAALRAQEYAGGDDQDNVGNTQKPGRSKTRKYPILYNLSLCISKKT